MYDLKREVNRDRKGDSEKREKEKERGKRYWISSITEPNGKQ